MDTQLKRFWAGLALVTYAVNLLGNERNPHEIIVFTAWFLLVAGTGMLLMSAVLWWANG
jgi:hypothetical protein